jgi:hypothetical protein
MGSQGCGGGVESRNTSGRQGAGFGELRVMMCGCGLHVWRRASVLLVEVDLRVEGDAVCYFTMRVAGVTIVLPPSRRETLPLCGGRAGIRDGTTVSSVWDS